MRKYLSSQKWAKFSPAQLELSSYQMNFDNILESIINENPSLISEDIGIKEIIMNETVPDKLVGYMRRSEYTHFRKELRLKLLAYETQVTPLIQEKLLHNGQDFFIETAVRFFMYTKQNPCEWIMQNYTSFRSEYLKSLLCLVLGIRGTNEYISFLKNEANRFSKAFPSETFNEGPLCGLQAILEKQN